MCAAARGASEERRRMIAVKRVLISSPYKSIALPTRAALHQHQARLSLQHDGHNQPVVAYPRHQPPNAVQLHTSLSACECGIE